MERKNNLLGAAYAKKKNGQVYYRASITNQGRHISLGSFTKEADAHQAYIIASTILCGLHLEQDLGNKAVCLLSNTVRTTSGWRIDDYEQYGLPLSFEKWVMLLNLRDSGMYCRNPIYLQNRYFLYYIDRDTPLKFDAEDLFFYRKHKIMKRGGHLFVEEYGMQVGILSRYGVKNYAVAGRDYRFINGDNLDFRYRNIEVINRFHGVTQEIYKGKKVYIAKIHINGDMIVGRYDTELESAVAYNKAADLLRDKGVEKRFPLNYIEELDEIEYAATYVKIRISRKVREYINGHSIP